MDEQRQTIRKYKGRKYIYFYSKEKADERMRRDLIKNKKIVFDHYGWKCMCCGETTPQFLGVDHVNNDGFKDKNKSGKKLTGLSLYRKIIKEGFGPRYQILCSNCNQGKRMNKGVCPHQSIQDCG
jgi:hypothetical protein